MPNHQSDHLELEYEHECDNSSENMNNNGPLSNTSQCVTQEDLMHVSIKYNWLCSLV